MWRRGKELRRRIGRRHCRRSPPPNLVAVLSSNRIFTSHPSLPPPSPSPFSTSDLKHLNLQRLIVRLAFSGTIHLSSEPPPTQLQHNWNELRCPPLQLFPFASSSLSFFQFPFPIDLLFDPAGPSASLPSWLLSIPHPLFLLLLSSSFYFLFSVILAFLDVIFVSFFSSPPFCLLFVSILFLFVGQIHLPRF
jgi:hypothetical protein